MRGRTGLCVALMAAALMIGASGGCKSPQQKEQERAQKQAAAQRKAQQQQAEANARAQQERIAAQQRAEQQRIAEERKRAEEYARAEQKRMADQRQIAEANARAEQEKAAAQARVDRENAAKQAAINQEQAAAQAQLNSQSAAAAAAANQQRAEAEAAAQRQAAANAKNKKKSKPAKAEMYPDDDPWVIGEPYIRPENYPQLLDKHVQAMAAAGAANDSSLYDQHFDGGELNALGRSKVALMFQGAPKNAPLTIYIPPSGSNERLQARLAAVNKFWRDSQWAALQVQAKQGTNPANAASAASGIAGLRKLEKEESESSNGGGIQTGDAPVVGSGPQSR